MCILGSHRSSCRIEWLVKSTHLNLKENFHIIAVQWHSNQKALKIIITHDQMYRFHSCALDYLRLMLKWFLASVSIWDNEMHKSQFI